MEVVRDKFGNEIKRRGAISSEESEKVRRARGEMTLGELLLCRARYLTAGAVIGSRHFVNSVFDAQPDATKGKRKTGARRMQGGEWGGGKGSIYSLRDLRKDVIT